MASCYSHPGLPGTVVLPFVVFQSPKALLSSGVFRPSEKKGSIIIFSPWTPGSIGTKSGL